jgi:hypothetical protein
VNEVSSLVYDPYGPPKERWKLFWHHYLRANEDGEFQNGWIGYKSAATPQELRAAGEIKLFAGLAYDATNNELGSKTHPPLGGRPLAQVNALNKDLDMCIVLTEPGATATPSGIYLSLVCQEPRVRNVIGLLGIEHFGTEGRVIMLKCDSPCEPSNQGAWRYIATMLTTDAAKSMGFQGYSAPDLFAIGDTAYLMVSPISDKPVMGAYNGCVVFRFANLESGALETIQGRPKLMWHIHGHPNTFNGACTYSNSTAASGFLFGEIKFAGKPIFQIFRSAKEH